MYERLTIDRIEDLRRKLNLDRQSFSLRLGYSPRAYPNAYTRGRISKWMRKEIAHRYGRILSEMFQ
jgi:HEPN domain-containing protein